MGEAMARDIERVGSQQVPQLAGRTTSGSLFDWTRSSAARRELTKMYGDALKRVEGFLPSPNAPLSVPALSPLSMTFREIREELSPAGTAFRSTTPTKAASTNRRVYSEAWPQVYTALEAAGVPPDEVAQFIKAREAYAAAKGYRSVLGGAFEDRALVPQKLQEALGKSATETRPSAQEGLERRLGGPGFQRLADVILRGAKEIEPTTGQPTLAVGRADKPGTGISNLFHSVMFRPKEGGSPQAFTYVSTPRGAPVNKYISDPKRPLPYTMGRGGRDILSVLGQLGRRFMTSEPDQPPAVP